MYEIIIAIGMIVSINGLFEACYGNNRRTYFLGMIHIMAGMLITGIIYYICLRYGISIDYIEVMVMFFIIGFFYLMFFGIAGIIRHTIRFNKDFKGIKYNMPFNIGKYECRETKKCPYCNTVMEGRFCSLCGTGMDTTDEEYVEKNITVVKESGKW